MRNKSLQFCNEPFSCSCCNQYLMFWSNKMKSYSAAIAVNKNSQFMQYTLSALLSSFPWTTQKFIIQSTLGFETLDKAAALGLETATPLTDPRQYINSNLGFRNLKIWLLYSKIAAVVVSKSSGNKNKTKVPVGDTEPLYYGLVCKGW